MFDSLDEEINEVAAAITQIRQQTAALNTQKEMVTGIVDSLAAIAEENAASTEETSASMLELNEIVEACHKDMGKLTSLAEQLVQNTKHFSI